MIILFVALLVAAAVAFVVPARFGVSVARVGAALLAAVAVGSVLSGQEKQTWEWGWIGDLGLRLDLGFDGFATLMVVLVAGLGALVLWYSSDYFPDHRAYGRFVGLFLGFAVAMSGLVMSSDLFTMFVFWELTSVFSFLLIGMNDESASARKSAMRALLVTGSGGICLLVGVILFQNVAGTSTFAELAVVDQGGTLFTVAAMFVLVGALTKSAQFPFHFWLPGAMSAPTPVSAYLHSATMVKAGVVLIARMTPVVADIDLWRWTTVVLGGITMIVGGVAAMRQTDAKLLLAHSTVSQLGMLVLLFGIGSPVATFAGVAHLAAHAFFKAGLFLSVGVIDHSFGTRDIRSLSGVGRTMPLVAVMTAVSGASMAGVIPFFGFVSKEKSLVALLEPDAGFGAMAVFALVAVILGSTLTVAYTTRLLLGLLGTKPDREASVVDHAPGAGLTIPVAATVLVTCAGGLAAAATGRLLAAPAKALDAEAKGYLVLWPGINTAFVLSVLIVVIGALAGRALHGREAGQGGRAIGEKVFDRLYDGLLSGSKRVTAVTQSGSLVAYNMVILAVVVAALGIPAASFIGEVTGDVVVADSWIQAVLVVLGVAFALGVAVSRERFNAAIMLGGVGFVCAAIFGDFGAPDLAVTQLLVEALVIVVFLLVARQMPRSFASKGHWAPRSLRLVVSVAVGVSVATFTLMASLSRTAQTVGEEYIVRSAPEGGGNNVVNVILVDFRGTDTMGEVMVLAIAALGVTQLVRVARSARSGEGAR